MGLFYYIEKKKKCGCVGPMLIPTTIPPAPIKWAPPAIIWQWLMLRMVAEEL